MPVSGRSDFALARLSGYQKAVSVKLLAKSGAGARTSRAARGHGAAQPAAAPRPLTDDIAVDLVRLFKLLADETRLRIVHYLLQNDEIHVRAFCELLAQSQPAVSHHLALLREAGLIDLRREGKHNFYHLLPAGFRRFLDLIFSSVPQEDQRIRFEEYVLSYSPPPESRR
jgi:ArsR family transcriptional regulator, arsenate/arsenite/antimonite-responsive transcriptional repressor